MNGAERTKRLVWLTGQYNAARVIREREELKSELSESLLSIARDLDAPIRWHPITDAPKDGAVIVLLIQSSSGRRHVTSGAWSERYECWDTESGMYRHTGATHFAELKGPDHE